MTFDEESKALYDAVAEPVDMASLDTARRWELMREIYAVPHLPSDLE